MEIIGKREHLQLEFLNVRKHAEILQNIIEIRFLFQIKLFTEKFSASIGCL